MDRSEGVNIALGALLVGIGAVIVGLLAPTAAWIVAGICLAGGIYLIAAVYGGWWRPTTATDRLFAPKLTLSDAYVVRTEGNDVIFRVAIENEGRGDAMTNSVVNLIVPEFVENLYRCTQQGQRHKDEGATSSAPESLVSDAMGRAIPSRTWLGFVPFPGRTFVTMYFRGEMQPPRDFSLRIEVVDEALHESFTPPVAHLSIPQETA